MAAYYSEEPHRAEEACHTATASHLFPAHRKMLAESAIAPSLLLPQRYESVTNPKRLRALGFSHTQAANVPGLLMHYGNAAGDRFAQYRPDRKREGGAKYETPPGKPGKYGLDIPESVRQQVLHTATELWITEGCKKADAAVSAGLCCVSLPGVWMFVHDKQPLADFDLLPLQGRAVVICYDSDAMTKESVHGALGRLAGVLRSRGANTRFCYLPDDGETKVGLDDYLAAGNSLATLRGLVDDHLRAVVTNPVKALISTLNRRCQDLGKFQPKQLQLIPTADDTNVLQVLQILHSEEARIKEAMRYWMGDAYNRLTLEHGQKLQRLDAAIGEGNRRKIGNWGSVCKAFEGDRDYFRQVAPWWFLEAVCPLPPSVQDEMLAQYLQAETAARCKTSQEAQGVRMTRAKLREQIAAWQHTDDKVARKTAGNVEWRTLPEYLPDEFLHLYRDAIACESAVEVNKALMNTLRALCPKSRTQDAIQRGSLQQGEWDSPLIAIYKGDNLPAQEILSSERREGFRGENSRESAVPARRARNGVSPPGGRARATRVLSHARAGRHFYAILLRRTRAQFRRECQGRQRH